MVTVNATVSNKIRNLGLICSILVVCIHIAWPHVPFNASWWIENWVREGVARIAVPFFFVVSGYLLALHFEDAHWWKSACQKRLSSLLVPYLFWSAMYVFWELPLPLCLNLVSGRALFAGITIDWPDVWHWTGLDLSQQPLLWPLWYVRALVVFVLVAPLFKFVLDRFGLWWISLVACCMLFGTHMPSVLRYVSIPGILYFSIGIWLATGGGLSL